MTSTRMWKNAPGSAPLTSQRQSWVFIGFRHLVRLPAYGFLGLIWVYQRTISPMLGDVCRYYPSCSHYGAEAIRVHGALKGTALTVRRLLRCTPFHAGGPDPVPPKGRWRSAPENAEATAQS